MVSRAIALFGTEQANPPMRTLRAGSLSAEFDDGALRYIRFGGIEVLRAHRLSRARRELGNLRAEDREPSFRGTGRRLLGGLPRNLLGRHAHAWSTTPGSPAGTTARCRSRSRPSRGPTCSPTAPASSSFTRWRASSGHSVKVLHVDGREEISTFPETIDPRCPFKDIRALSHEIAPGRRGDLHDAWRRLRNGGPAQLVRRILQDLCAAAAPGPGPIPCRRARSSPSP